MKLAIIDNGTDCLEQLVYLCRAADYTFDIFDLNSLGEQELKQYDLVILSGRIWYDDPAQHTQHYEKELRLIAKSDTPIIGICLGMQLIVSSFGGTLHTLKHPAHGEKVIELNPLGQELLHWPPKVTVFVKEVKEVRPLLGEESVIF